MDIAALILGLMAFCISVYNFIEIRIEKGLKGATTQMVESPLPLDPFDFKLFETPHAPTHTNKAQRLAKELQTKADETTLDEAFSGGSIDEEFEI